MTTADATRTRVMRITPAALTRKVEQQLARHRRTVDGPAPVILLRAEPQWTTEPTLVLADGIRLRVAVAVSTLAVWDQLVGHLAGDTPEPLVILTDLTDTELGHGILSEVFRNRVITVEPWSLIADCFGAQRIDPRLANERWAGAALIDAMPSTGWPKLSGTLLTRDVALSCLAAARLGLNTANGDAENLDGAALLRWTLEPEATAALTNLQAEERTGLQTWLVERTGSATRPVFALIEAGRVEDSIPFGLVCAALWSDESSDTSRAKGRADQYLNDQAVGDPELRALGTVAEQVIAEMLGEAGRDGVRSAAVALRLQQVLDRAEELVIQLGAQIAAARSPILRTGFDHRIGVVAVALQRTLDEPGPAAAQALEAAAAVLGAHRLASRQEQRVERATMALRLVRWLADGDASPPENVSDAIDRQVTQWAWVDLALTQVWAGEEAHPALQAVYRSLYHAVAARRRALDEAFANRLAAWTTTGGQLSGSTVVVEKVLERVIAPLVRAGGPPTLLVILDGMSTAVAAELAQELTNHGLVEFDVLAGVDKGAPPRRRGVVAALPTLTTVSRASLLSGKLRTGGQDDERVAFEAHPLWGGRPARLFHKGSLHGGAGEVLGTELVQALGDPQTLVAVVINTVDDALDRGRESADASWRLGDLGPLRVLLDHARSAGRAVILTSDHGHVLHRDGTHRSADAPGSGRHRSPGTTPVGAGEVLLSGSRVLAEEHRIVALWNPDLRYGPKNAGYHGGAALAEVTIPLLAFLSRGAEVPAGWGALSDQRPVWWDWTTPAPPVTRQVVPPRKARQHSAQRAEAAGQVTLDIQLDPPMTDSPVPSLIDALFASEMFEAQQSSTARRMPKPKIRGALDALLAANNTLPLPVLAQRAGEAPARANGFATTLARILNVDNFEVLQLIDDGQTVRLNVALLRTQFGLPDDVR
ncbi:BREX-2 system phosphatase PglZ [Dactylosporangium sp. NPDC005555]|uniref:BREX-2 system phosphatase PglZ n=1 Tax=Dactylosporangium sp. NPDC005555 TaxID=3154889 RepID=UPI0033A84A03